MRNPIALMILFLISSLCLKAQDSSSLISDNKYKEISFIGGTQPIESGLYFSIGYNWRNTDKFINLEVGYDALLYDYIMLNQVGYKGFQASLYNFNFLLTHSIGKQKLQVNIGLGPFLGAGIARLTTTRIDYYHYNEEYIVGGKGIFDITYQLNNRFKAVLRNSVFSAFTLGGDSFTLYGVQLGLAFKFQKKPKEG